MADSKPELPARGIAAHRGGAGTAPENTLAAFREAARLGAHQIELDVRATADGEVVVIHDATLDRTSDGRGRVSRTSLSELRRLDVGIWKGARHAGASIPTLDEALTVMPRDVWINVQIKRDEPVARRVAESILRADRGRQTLVACGNAAAREVRRVHPDIAICNLARQHTREAYVEHARATGADFVQLHHLRGVPSAEIVARAHASGLRVNYFCDPAATGLPGLFAAGVDFVLVDDLVAAFRAVRHLGICPVARGEGGRER